MGTPFSCKFPSLSSIFRQAIQVAVGRHEHDISRLRDGGTRTHRPPRCKLPLRIRRRNGHIVRALPRVLAVEALFRPNRRRRQLRLHHSRKTIPKKEPYDHFGFSTFTLLTGENGRAGKDGLSEEGRLFSMLRANVTDFTRRDEYLV